MNWDVNIQLDFMQIEETGFDLGFENLVVFSPLTCKSLFKKYLRY